MSSLFELRVDGGLLLSVLDESHAQELFQLTDNNRAYLRTWLPWLDKNKYPQNSLDFINESQKNYEQKISINLGIFYRTKLTGVISLYGIDWQNRSTSIGYWIGEKYQGKGLITKSCRALTDYAFRDLELNRVDIRCAPGNTKSRSVPERLGFQKEGVLRQADLLYDHYVDHVVYSMLKEQWLRST